MDIVCVFEYGYFDFFVVYVGFDQDFVIFGECDGQGCVEFVEGVDF